MLRRVVGLLGVALRRVRLGRVRDELLLGLHLTLELLGLAITLGSVGPGAILQWRVADGAAGGLHMLLTIMMVHRPE